MRNLSIGHHFHQSILEGEGDFPTDFRPLGWVHSTDKSWWGRMVGFVLTELGDLLKQVGLYHAVRAVQYGLSQISHHFYGVMERYNPLTSTFFTLVGEMGLALHELSVEWTHQSGRKLVEKSPLTFRN